MDIPSIPNAGWVLSRLPVIAYFAGDDENNTMRVISGVEREVFGYPVDDILNKANFLNAEFLEPEDQKIVSDHRELIWIGASPVISRFDMRDASGKPIPSLLISQALYSDHTRIGVCGVICDLSSLHVLQCPKGVLSRGTRSMNWNQRADLPEEFTDSWLAGVLPIVLLVTENDRKHTIQRVSGSLERIVGHGAEQVVDHRKLMGWSTIDPGVLELADDLMNEVMKSGACGVQRMTFVHRNGREVPILAIVAPYFPPDGSRGVFLSALMDITDVPVLQGPAGIVPFDRDVQPPG